MDIFNKTNTNLSIISFIITIMFVYFTSPTPNIIHKYPTPETADKLIYQKHSGECDKYNPNVVPCPSNPTTISS